MSWLLHEAAAKGDIGEVELLAHPGTVNLLDGKGQTPLHRAAKSGSILVTRHLLKKGAISDTVDKAGRSPVMVAAMSRNDEIMSLLLGWPDSKSSQDGAKALTHEPAETYPPGIKAQEVSGHQIAGLEQRKFMAVDVLLGDDEPKLYTDADPYKHSWTKLHWEAHKGRHDAVKKLLASGAQADIRDQIGRTPLHLAAFRGHAGISLELLRHGADPGAVTHDNSTAAALAAAMGHEDTAEMLLAHLKETIRNSADISMLRLRGGMQIGSPQGVAGTPRAFQNKAKQAVQKLNEIQSDPRAPRLATTALHIAAGVRGSGNISDLREALNDHDVDVKDAEGRTPLHIAAQCEDYDIIRLLLQKGANVKAVDFSRRTPLHFSAQGGFERICRGFINEGADVNATDRSLQTPLHFAASEGHGNVVQVLLRNNADRTLKDSSGRTAYDLAARSGHTPVMKLLRDSDPLDDPDPRAVRDKEATLYIGALSRDELCTEMAKLQKRNARIASERDRLRDDLSKAEREEKQLKEDNEFLMGKNKKLESKVANMESLNRAAPEEVQAEIEKLQAEAAQAKRRYNMDLEDTRKEIARGKQALNQMEMLIVKVTKDLTEEKEKYLSQVNIEKERREKMADIRDKLQQGMRESEAENYSLKQELQDALRRLRENGDKDREIGILMEDKQTLEQDVKDLERKLKEKTREAKDVRDKLQQDMRESNAEIDSLKQELQDALRRLRENGDKDREIGILVEDKQTLEQGVKDLERKLKEKTREAKDLETACSNWEMRYRELENEYNKKARDASSLEKEARELTDKLQSKDREIQEMLRARHEANNKLDKANAELPRLHALLVERDGVLAEIKQELDDTNAKLQDASSRLKEREKEVKRLERQVAEALDSNMQASNSWLEKLEKANEQLEWFRHQLAAKEQKLQGIAAEAQNLQIDVGTLQEELGKAQHDKRVMEDGLQKAIHKMKEQIGSLNTRIDLYECEIDNLKDQNQRLQAALLSAEGALAMVEEDRSKIARELEAKELELAETSRQLGELEAKASKQNHELQNLDEETQRLHTDRQQWQAIADQLGSQEQQLKEEVQKVHDDLEKLRRENAMLQNQVQRLSEENNLLEEQVKAMDQKLRVRTQSMQGDADRKLRDLERALDDKEEKLRALEEKAVALKAELQRASVKLEELKGEKREADRQNSRLKQEVDSLQAEVDGRTGGRGDTAAGEVMQLQEVVSSMESELSDMRASNDALKSEILRLQAQLGGGEDERKLEAKLREAKKKQHAFAGQQIVDESVDMTGKAVDAIMESFLMPRKAMDMAVEVERKKEQAKTGLTFA